MDPVGYTFEADVHCVACTLRRFGVSSDDQLTPDLRDGEGNAIGAIFPWDEPGDLYRGDHCGGCFAPVLPPMYTIDESEEGGANEPGTGERGAGLYDGPA